MLEIRQEVSVSVCVNSCTKNQQWHCNKMNDIRFLKLSAFLCRESALTFYNNIHAMEQVWSFYEQIPYTPLYSSHNQNVSEFVWITSK